MTKIRSKAAFFLLAIVTIGILANALQKEKKKEDTLVKLNASVTFDGNRIVVINKDTIDYINAVLTLNGYYKIMGINLRAGETYTFWPVEFAHMNGKRLPAKQKPHQFAIWCGLIEGGNGFYSEKLDKH